MPLLWLSLAFVLGIWLGNVLAWSLAAWLAIALGCLLVFVLFFLAARRGLHLPALPARLAVRFQGLPRPPLPPAILIGVFLLGAVRIASVQPAFNERSLVNFNDHPQRLIIDGVLVEPPEVRDNKTLLRVEAQQYRLASDPQLHPVEGRLLARSADYTDFHYGDRLRLEGFLETPPEFENFSYRTFLARAGVFSYMPQARAWRIGAGEGFLLKQWIWTLRARALETIFQLFPDPEAALLAGILLGVEGMIPAPLLEAFRTTGTAHIIAISGFNMTIVAGLFVILFSRLFGRWWGAVVAILGIAFYTLLVGAGAGVVRAAIMSAFTLIAVQIGRRQNGLNSLAFIAALMALWTPYVLWDVSFQLSFAATLGLVIFADPLTAAFTRLAGRFLPPTVVNRLVGPVSAYILLTLAAQVMVLPLQLYYFSEISLVSLLANPMVLPVQPPLMTFSGLAMLLGMVSLPLGKLVALLAWPFPAFTIRAVELLAQIPLASVVVGPVGVAWVVVFYALLLGVVFLRDRIKPLAVHWKPSFAFLGLGVLALAAWRAVFILPDGLLHLTVLDVGTGDALLVQAPGGTRVLVDGGPSPNSLSDALGRRLPFGDRGLDWIIVAGTEAGQIGALPWVLERFPPKNILWSGPDLGTSSARALQSKLTSLGLVAQPAETGQSLDLGDGVTMKVLAVTPRGAVLLLEYGSFRALLPHGMDFDTLEALSVDSRLADLTALLLPDSGFAPLNPPEWLERLHPQVTLLSVAAGDANGLPDPGVVQSAGKYNLLRTDKNGWIELTTDGEKMWVEVEKTPGR